MTQRSPMHERYQRNTAPAGKTRRSASAAKPKREAGGAGGGKPVAKKSSRPTLRESLRSPVPVTPEIRKWSRIRWALFGVAILLVLPVLFIPAVKTNNRLVLGISLVYLATLGGALYIDFAVIRPLREKAAAGKGGKGKKDGRA